MRASIRTAVAGLAVAILVAVGAPSVGPATADAASTEASVGSCENYCAAEFLACRGTSAPILVCWAAYDGCMHGCSI